MFYSFFKKKKKILSQHPGRTFQKNKDQGKEQEEEKEKKK